MTKIKTQMSRHTERGRKIHKLTGAQTGLGRSQRESESGVRKYKRLHRETDRQRGRHTGHYVGQTETRR